MSEYDDTASAEPGADEQWVDYFSFVREDTLKLSGGQEITFKALNEKERARYQHSTSRPVSVSSRTRDISFSADPAADRVALITACVTDWKLRRAGAWTTRGQDPRGLKDLLELADPAFVDKLEAFARKVNPWLSAGLTVEDIDAQIKDLQGQRAALVEEERLGESS